MITQGISCYLTLPRTLLEFNAQLPDLPPKEMKEYRGKKPFQASWNFIELHGKMLNSATLYNPVLQY
jgi:hypothetical protein